MQVIEKTVKTSQFNGQNWRIELNNMLFNYRIAPPKTTNQSPSKLLFNRNITGKLPSFQQQAPNNDEMTRNQQRVNYEKAKQHFDKKHHTKHIDNISVGNTVIFKLHDRAGKLTLNIITTYMQPKKEIKHS